MQYSIALTPGEPAGIGPDLVLQLAAEHKLKNVLIYADKNLLMERARQLGLEINFNELAIHSIALAAPALPGELNTLNSSYVLNCLKLATENCLAGQHQALVTGPVHKGIINDAGIAFTGHTEFLAELSKVPRSVMLLANEKLKIALLTTHLALRDVPDAITVNTLRECIQILHYDLIHKFKIIQPRIAVCALNPHAGENGHLGNEELTTIIPTLNELRAQGINLLGPLSADTAFTAQQTRHYDVILAMYHDQGLPVIKAQGFGETVNITLGLPFIRTSVDHGTALSLAGTKKADSSSLKAALVMARSLISN